GQWSGAGMEGPGSRNLRSPVRNGGGPRGRQPDAVHPQPRQVVEPGDHSPQVAVPVPVAVPPGPDVDLVQVRPVPPVLPGRVPLHVPPTAVIRPRPRSQQATSVTAGRARTRTRPRPCYPPHLRPHPDPP